LARITKSSDILRLYCSIWLVWSW